MASRSMKDSGVEWIGKIPKEWNIKKMSLLADRITDYVASGSFASLKKNVNYLSRPDYAMLIRTVDLSGSSNKQPVYVDKSAYEFLSNSNLFGGELVLSNIGSVGNVYMYTPMYKRATLAPNSIMVNMKGENRFYYYWFLNPIVNETLKLIGSDSVQTKFNKTQLRAFKVVEPPFEEQQKIATFLDEKVSHIDNIIEDTKKSIENLKAYKQSLITETVTKGLDPNVEMKDSGIEYIGKIPKNWSLSKLGYLGNLQNGISKAGDFFGSGYPFVSYGDVYKNSQLPSNVSGLIESNSVERERYSVEYGDVFFTRTSETIEEVGFVSTCLKTIDNAVFAGFLIRFRPNDDQLEPSFSKYYFRSNLHRKYFVKEMNIVTRASLSQSLLKKLPVLLPSKEEQLEIAQFLFEKTTHITSIIEQKEQLITELESYKKSLIYECVTGKKEVK